MEAEYTISEELFINANRLHFRKRENIHRRLAVIGGCFCILIFLLPEFLAPSWVMRLILCVLTMFLCLFGSIGVFFENSASSLRKRYQKLAAKESLTVRIRLENEGIRFFEKDGELLLRWEQIKKWKQNEHCVLVYRFPTFPLIISKSIADSGFDFPFLLETLCSKVGKAEYTSLKNTIQST